MRVVTVLQARRQLACEFAPVHVQSLQRQIKQWSPDVEFVCLTDTDVPGVDCLPLWEKYPGWWAKLSMFHLQDDFLYMDLDSVVLGPIEDFFTVGTFAAPMGGSALMHFTAAERFAILADWRADPMRHITEQSAKRRWDTGVIGKHIDMDRVVLADQWHYTKGNQPYVGRPDTRIALFSGRPRPWHRPDFRSLYR